MKVNAGVHFEPAITLWLVSVQVVEDDMDLSPDVLGNHVVHEIQELASSTPGRVPGRHLTGGNIQSCKQSRCAMTFIAVAESVHGFAVGHSQKALRPLQRLNVRLFVDCTTPLPFPVDSGTGPPHRRPLVRTPGR